MHPHPRVRRLHLPLFQCQKKLSGEPELLQPLRNSKASWLQGASTSTWELLPGSLLLQARVYQPKSSGGLTLHFLSGVRAPLLPRMSKAAKWENCNFTPTLDMHKVASTFPQPMWCHLNKIEGVTQNNPNM